MPGAWVERFTTHYLGCVEELLAEPDFPLAELPDDAYHFARYALTGQGREAYCAAGHAMLWLTPTGHFTACGLFSRGEEWLGHVDEVSSAEELRGLLARPLARRLREDAPPTPAPCLSCRWLPVCRGGCPALTALPGTPETPPLCAFYTSLGETLERLLVPRAGAEFAPRRAFDV
jgi:radical SAM protein with 4Fe4S-binding SPASM domain